ncbi:MAG: phosphate/phosphite/phosphonate ABC transporter substrate-binding protein [Dehalococcoidales bacterium]
MARLLILPLLAALLLSTAACSSEAERRRIDFGETEPIAPVDTGEESGAILRIAFAGVISPKETLKTYESLLSYIGRQFHRSVEIVQRETYAEINDLVESLDVDLAFVCSLAYVVGNDDFGMELLAVPEVNGETTYHSYIIVSATSDIHFLDDLRGKTFAFSDPLSNSGRLAPTYRLYRIGETPEAFFERVSFTYSHDRSIRAVADGLVDGAAVDSLVYDFIVAAEPEIAAQTRIIEISDPFGIPPVIVHPGLDPEIKARLRELFLGLDEDTEGSQILDDLMIDRFVVGDDAAYDSIRSRVRELGW